VAEFRRKHWINDVGRWDNKISIITLHRAMTKKEKKVVRFSRKNRNDTVSCRTGDTNPSDATGLDLEVGS